MRISVTWGAKCLFLLETVRGGLSQSRGEQVHPFARLEGRRQFEHRRENNNGGGIPAGSSVEDDSTTTERLKRIATSTMFPTPEQEGLTRLIHEEDWKYFGGKRSRRVLQTSCAEGDPFTITSSAFPSLEGCMINSGFESANGNLMYNSSSALVASTTFSTTTTESSAEVFWVVYEILGDNSFVIHCFSNESSTALPYPVEATWICDVDGDGESEFPTASQFSTSCGCLTTTITTTTIGTETTTTTESGSATCNEGGSFTITSTAFPEVVGCYSDTGTLTENEVVYTEAGTSDAGQNAVVAVNIGEDSAQDIRWVVAFSSLDTTSRESECYCFSTDQASSVHPADVTSWICDVDGDGEFEISTSSQFSTSCGCSTTTASTTDTGTEPTITTETGTETTTTTDTDTETTTTTDTGTETTTGTDTTTTTDTATSATCNEGESFTITSTFVPEVAGCYSDTGTLTEKEVVYTETGTSDDGQNTVRATNVGEDSAQDIRWIVLYSSLETTSREDESYCASTDQASSVHPADVTYWICLTDTTGEQELVSPEEFSISCGCSSTSMTSATSPTLEAITIESSPSPLASTAPELPTLESTTMPGTPVTTSSAAPGAASPQPVATGIVPTTVMPIFPVSALPTPEGITEAPSAASRGIVPSASPAPASSISPTESMTLTDLSPTPVSIAFETTPPSPGSGSPPPTPIATDTCDGEFWVTSSMAPVLEGCFQATVTNTTATDSGEILYSVVADGQSEGTAIVAPGRYMNFPLQTLWGIGFVSSGTSTNDTVFYCVSEEIFDEVHPADATWLCDLSGDGSVSVDYVEVSDTDLAVTCGCSRKTPTPTSIPGSEQDVDIGYLSITLSASVTVGVGLAATVVHVLGF